MVREDGATRKTQVKAVFDRLAEVYDAAGPGCFAYFGKRLVEELVVEPGIAGFVDPQVIADSKVFRHSDVDEYWENARSTGLRRQLDGLDAEQTKRVRDALVERVAPHQHADGIYLEATALLAFASR